MKPISLPPLIYRIFNLAAEETASEYAMLVHANGTKCRILKEVSGNSDSGCEGERLGIVREALKGENPLLTSSRKIPADFRCSGGKIQDNAKHVLCIPLIVKGNPSGALYFEKRTSLGDFSSQTIETLVSLCSPINLAIKNAIGVEEDRGFSLGDQGSPFVGKSRDFQDVLTLIDRVKNIDTPVFICGESGTGKELVARSIHQSGKRRKGKFIAINCGAIPDLLLESELFGYTRGSFTGALRDKRGLIEEADGGTFFLDEIGDLSLHLQAKLLRLLQENEIRRIGENHTRSVDVRFISATNKNIENEIKRGCFREDLYYRLKIITIFLTPLRERREDILCLLNHFVEKYCAEMGIGRAFFSPPALDLLMGYAWPGNVRELQNEVQRCLVMCGRESFINEACLSSKIKLKGKNPDAGICNFFRAKAEFEKRFLNEALTRSCYNRTKTAKEIGITRQGLFKLMKKHRIEVPRRKVRSKE